MDTQTLLEGYLWVEVVGVAGASSGWTQKMEVLEVKGSVCKVTEAGLQILGEQQRSPLVGLSATLEAQ